MIAEVNAAQSFLIKKFGGVQNVKPGIYAVPYGNKFMRVKISDDMGMSGFELYQDEQLTIPYKR